MSVVFSPVTVGRFELPNRLAMAPLTRNRSGAHGVPTALNAQYYGQRASEGFLITEGTQPSAVGQGYLNTPGIHTPEQVAGWREVAEAVHARGGKVFIQLMHVGRLGHPANKQGLETVAPSAIAAPGTVVTPDGDQHFTMPRALETDEIPGIVQDYVHAARCAREAGIDGVEIHGANGYLLHQFLASSTNQRTDAYAGSAPARARLTIEVVTAVAEAIGADRVGLRISPAHNIQGVLENDPAETRETYKALVEAIAPLGLAYLSIIQDPASELVAELKDLFGGPLMLNSGFATITSLQDAETILAENGADLVAVGRMYIANPDLPQRWRTGAELNEPEPLTFYGGGAQGYTDYPALASNDA